MSLQAITIPPQTTREPAGLILILHGWGANAQDVEALAPALDLPGYQVMLPNAPFPHPYTASGRMWYSLPESYGFAGGFDLNQGLTELVASRKLLMDWIKSLPQATGIPLDRTILSGFSQGGAMALDVGLQLPLAGIMVLSGYLHTAIAPEPPEPPILMVHGSQDSRVPLSAAHQARDVLLGLNVRLEYHELEMGHEISLLVLDLMRKFVQSTIAE